MGKRAVNPSEKIAQEIPIEVAPRTDTARIAAIFLSAFRNDPFMLSLFRRPGIFRNLLVLILDM